MTKVTSGVEVMEAKNSKNLKPNFLKLVLSKIFIVGCFLFVMTFIVFSAYLQFHRPQSPDFASGFVVYKKFLGKPFYISKNESITTDVLLYLFLTFGIFAKFFDKASKV